MNGNPSFTSQKDTYPALQRLDECRRGGKMEKEQAAPCKGVDSWSTGLILPVLVIFLVALESVTGIPISHVYHVVQGIYNAL